MKVHCTYIPCLLEDRRIEFFSHNLTIVSVLLSLIQKFPEIREDSPMVAIRVNGKRIPPFGWRNPLNDGDKVLIIQDIGDPITDILLAIGGAIASVATWVGGLSTSTLISLALTVSSLAYTIYSYATAPEAAKTGRGLNSSPTYGWEGATMQVRQGIPVPTVHGEHMEGGNICLTTSDYLKRI
jgi:hypothetical protein